jgi:adenylosuccinate lyase
MQRNFATYAPFASCERLLMHLVKAGADRQEMHETLRQHALHAWQVIQQGDPNPLIDFISSDPKILSFLPPDQITKLMQVENYTGIAVAAAQQLAQQIRRIIV